MTESEKRQIINMWENGVSLEQIYRMFPYRRYEVLKEVKKMRLKGELKPRHRMKNAIEKVVAIWETQTKDPREIANILGYSPITVKDYLIISGVREGKRPSTNYKHCERTNEIVSALENGDAISKIARNVGVSRQYVHQIKKRLEKI